MSAPWSGCTTLHCTDRPDCSLAVSLSPVQGFSMELVLLGADWWIPGYESNVSQLGFHQLY